MRRNLVLIRHTKSDWSKPGTPDFDRTLKEERKDDAKAMSKKLKGLKLFPDLIICSPAKRTKQTAEFFCEQLKYDYNSLQFESRLYESSAETYLDVIREVDPLINTLVIIGHNPSTTDLASFLTHGEISHVPTTGVVWLELDSSDWSLHSTTPSVLRHFLTPKTI